MNTVRLIVVGGFLGAGKTTLLWRAAQSLMRRGRKVGLIANDQAPDLVDTAMLAHQGLHVEEVAGSCFCCNFQGLLGAARSLLGRLPADVLIAEPVGSCTDLSATLLQPLKDRYANEFRLAALSVLVDPSRLDAILGNGDTGLHPSAAYIIRKQLEEADSIVINKSDQLSPAQADELRARAQAAYPGVDVRFMSALNGDGVDAWLDDVLAGRPAGRRLADVDYDTYAEGEAVLGWLNARIELLPVGQPSDWRRFSEGLMAGIQSRCAQAGAEIGHVKLLLTSPQGEVAASATSLKDPVVLRGQLAPGSALADLVVNARVQTSPQELERIVREELDRACGANIDIRIVTMRSLSPGRPRPTHRYDHVVAAPAG
jgi:Ni2+-binding GTPase involved in maturation of urease and hydrogenase